MKIDTDARKPKRKLGRPTIFRKPLAKTFMMSQETFDLLDTLAIAEGCSRSDILHTAVREYAFLRHRQRHGAQ